MNIRLFSYFVTLVIKSRMEYRGAFTIGVVGQVVGYAANYLVIWLLLQNFNTIQGWDWTEIAFLYSLNLLTYAIGASFTYTPMVGLDQIIVNGNFDMYLTKPLSPFLYFLANLFNIGYIAHILISSVVLIWSISQADITWTLYKAIYLLLAIISGSLLQAAGLIVIGSLSFIFLRVQYLFSIFFKLKEFIAYPISVYGTLLQIILTWIIPLAMINYYPSLYIFEDSLLTNKILGITALVIGPLSLYLAYRFWMYGANKYQGAGG
ncbi:ABC transporter permease [Paenibacillus sp. GCM10012307]|uniref:ABC-2 family transporter protein n=1 Tax=Paenibacillus roseus TaxID=2798579 RepID=A0A934J1S3_9BACL|nr:ABC-2 family transporter protein [Paenibacillus roseus]MBJ6363212.1 ABC-2 family transporter protein [Paenibacillus roseus]